MPRVEVEQLVEAATVAFGTRGFDRASMLDVARLAGTTKPTLYARVGDKQALLLAALEREAALMLTHLQSTYDGLRQAGTAEMARESVRAGFTYAAERTAGYQLIFGAQAVAEIAQTRQQVVDLIELQVAELLTHWLARRTEPDLVPRPGDVRVAASLAVATCVHGIDHALRVDPRLQAATIDWAAERTLAFVVGGLLNSRDAPAGVPAGPPARARRAPDGSGP